MRSYKSNWVYIYSNAIGTLCMIEITSLSKQAIQSTFSKAFINFCVYKCPASSNDRNELVGRNNANDIDLNRNFPDRLSDKNLPGKFEPETVELMRWIQLYPFVLSANLHGGSLVANYPYDDISSDEINHGRAGHPTYAASPDDETFRVLAESYSLVCTIVLIG